MTDLAVERTPSEVAHDDGHSHPTSTGISNEKVAMWAFLGSECLLFGGLISTFLLYKDRAADGPVPHELYDIAFTSISSFVLLMSSLTMVLAVNAAKEGDDRNTRVWLSATALLGALFVGGQVYEFTAFYQEGLGFTTSLFGSSFFTLTGFHGVHVTLGIIMLLSTIGLSLSGRIGNAQAESVEIVGLYWHFVDLVWIFLFPVFYLL